MVTKTVAKTVNNKTSFKEQATKFFRGSWTELKKVHWPSRKELVTYTSVVLVSVLIVAALLWLFDSVFSFLLGKLILR
ncbi:Preprotein translocase subunit SecE [Moorella glycerini]|uniref:Protein translocase subunit SecE n=1 Tax=Neomoorella stamsii TaxID=1266720 RepID=A0A9X7J1W8_9FIRM|nr:MULTISPECIES: preprotein translocase subunit SecE [Moorella]PRR71311.1 preprotein translocase subunit SecE [Moorella stamsii]CEP69605.1 Preprotein translocase subunit SecE [Moorella glycerini]